MRRSSGVDHPKDLEPWGSNVDPSGVATLYVLRDSIISKHE
jgi:hypothetical protein